MVILIPVDKKDRFQSIISSIEENSAWSKICLEGSIISNVEFFDSYEEIYCLINKVIVINNLEFIWPFKEEGIEVFMVSTEKSIDEIIESMLLDKLKKI